MEVNLRGGGGGGGFLLPEDIVFDVLARLPAKVLCRLRCVCKGWRALISDKAFIAAQKSHAAPLIAGVFVSQCTGHKLELRLMDMDGTILRVFKGVPWHLVPARLDLICIYNMYQGGAAMIVDPTAGRMLAVGEPNPRFARQQMTSHSHCSLGRAALSGAYKVLRIHESYDGNDKLCEIATINDDCSSEPTWRPRPPPPVKTLWYQDQKATINGILYFVSYANDDTLQGGRYRFYVASFNLESEEWTEMIDGPATGLSKDMMSWKITLAELKETLNMIQTVYHFGFTSQDAYGQYINIWLLIDSKKSRWVKQYTINVPQNLSYCKALDVLGDGRILMLNEKPPYILRFYNPSTDAFTDIMQLPYEFVGAMAFYTGSLLPISTNGHT